MHKGALLTGMTVKGPNILMEFYNEIFCFFVALTNSLWGKIKLLPFLLSNISVLLLDFHALFW